MKSCCYEIYYLPITIGNFFSFSCSSNNPTQEPNTVNLDLYFPNTNDTWERLSTTDLGWNESAKQPLLDYLKQKNTKGFIMLYNGRLVIDAYFNGHNKSSL